MTSGWKDAAQAAPDSCPSAATAPVRVGIDTTGSDDSASHWLVAETGCHVHPRCCGPVTQAPASSAASPDPSKLLLRGNPLQASASGSGESAARVGDTGPATGGCPHRRSHQSSRGAQRRRRRRIGAPHRLPRWIRQGLEVARPVNCGGRRRGNDEITRALCPEGQSSLREDRLRFARRCVPWPIANDSWQPVCVNP